MSLHLPSSPTPYDSAVASFDQAVVEATNLSRKAAGREALPRPWWASVLFTRICTTSVSLISLAPKSRFAGRLIDHYDLSAVASLTRNLIEACLLFHYLCAEQVSDAEWSARLTLIQLHDCVTRLKMFRDFDPNDPDLPSWQRTADELRAYLEVNPEFGQLDPKAQKRFLTGDHAHFRTRDEIVRSMGKDSGHFRGLYRLLSCHVHTLPASFYRMAERNQGRGVESEVETGYITQWLTVSTAWLNEARGSMQAIFPNAIVDVP